MQKYICLVLILVSFPCFGCATGFTEYHIRLPSDFEMSATAVKDKIPLRAGLYLKPNIKNYVYELPHTTKYSITMGDALSSGCERILRNIFQDVILVDEMNVESLRRNTDIIVTPQLIGGLSGQYKVPEGYDKKKTVSQMTMQWDIVSHVGKLIYTTSIKGEAIVKPIMSFFASSIREKEKENRLRLLNDLFQKSQDDIYSSGWWKKRWWQDTDPQEK